MEMPPVPKPNLEMIVDVINTGKLKLVNMSEEKYRLCKCCVNSFFTWWIKNPSLEVRQDIWLWLQEKQKAWCEQSIEDFVDITLKI